jgi:hypothetical protein
MTWDAFHRRGEVLRAVIEAADIRRDGHLPMDLPGVVETFDDELGVVAALQLRWHTQLSGHIERALTEQPADLESAVVAAWRATAADLAGVRQILDTRTDSPTSEAMAAALLRARRKDWTLMAAMAGKAGPHDHSAARIGRAIESRARAGHAPTDAASRVRLAVVAR